MSIILSFDPGVTGAISYINTTTKEIDCLVIPKITSTVKVKRQGVTKTEYRNTINSIKLSNFILNFYNHFEDEHDFYLAIEKLHARETGGAVQQFSLGNSFGKLEMLIDLFLSVKELPMNRKLYIPPQDWKHLFRLDSEKEKSINLCISYFPCLKEHLKFKKDHDSAESVLIGLYVIMKLMKEKTIPMVSDLDYFKKFKKVNLLEKLSK